jgi:hypothetical protein
VPAQYVTVAASNLVVVRLDGLITKADAVATFNALVKEPFLGPGTGMLVRAACVTTDMSPGEIREQARLMPRLAERGLSHLAITAEEKMTYAFARFFSAFAEVPGCLVNAFRTEEEALAWMHQDEQALSRGTLRAGEGGGE